MLNKLLKLANFLDDAGLVKEADQVDALIKVVAGRHELFRALKNDDADGAKKAMTGMSNEDLGLTSHEFNSLIKDLTNAADHTDFDTAERERWMEIARKRLGLEKPVAQTVETHNPVTGKEWTGDKIENKLDSAEQSFIKNTMGKEVRSLEDLDEDESRELCNEIAGYMDGLKDEPEFNKVVLNKASKLFGRVYDRLEELVNSRKATKNTGDTK